MPHWTVEHVYKVIIQFLVPVFIVTIASTFWYAFKVPNLEKTLARHEDKLASISANLILLMNKSGEKLDEDKIKELISQVQEIGMAKARLINNAKVVEGTADIPVIEWVPLESDTLLNVSQTTVSPIKNKEIIEKLIFTTTVAKQGSTWSVVGNELIVNYPSGKIAFTPNKGIENEELERTAAEMNIISKGLSEAKIEEGAKVERKQ